MILALQTTFRFIPEISIMAFVVSSFRYRGACVVHSGRMEMGYNRIYAEKAICPRSFR